MADELGQIVIKITGDDDGFKDVLKRLRAAVQTWASGLVRDIDGAMREASGQLFTRIATQTDRIGQALNQSISIDPARLGVDRIGPVLAATESQVVGWGQRISGVVGNVMQVAGGVVLAEVLTRTGAAIKTALFDTNATLETSTLQFTTLMGSADEAAAHVKGLFAFAAATPFETGPIIEASRLMRTFGGSALDTKANLTLVGDAAAATGNQINEVGFWTARAYDAIQSGRPFGESAARLQEMGVLTGQARTRLEDMQKAGASGQEVWAAYTQELSRFNGAMLAQAGTWQGLTSSLSDLINLNLASIFQPAFEGAKAFAGALVNALSSAPVQAFVTQAQGQVQGFVDWLASAASGVMAFWGQVGPSVMAGLETIGQVGGLMAESLGAAFTALSELASAAFGWGEGVASAFADGIAAGVGYVASALGEIGDMVSYWLTPGSPPPLLPDLDVWGAGAASAYLEGWQSADFDSLKAFGSDIETLLGNLVSTGALGEGQDSTLLAGLRTEFVKVMSEARETGSVSAESMQRITDAAGPAGQEVAALARQHIQLAAATQKVNDAQAVLQSIQSEQTAAQAELAAAQATGNRGLANEARNRLILLKQQRADAAQKQATAQREQSVVQQQLTLMQKLMDAQKEQLALLKKAADAGKKGGGGGGKKQADETDKAKEAQWRYNFSLADTATKIQMLKEKQAGLNEGQAEYWNLQGQIAGLEKQRDAEALKGAEARAKAEFQHQMAMSDSAGKVDLLKKKLAGLDEGSAEYYQTLTELRQAEERLAKEQEAAAKKGGRGGGAGPSAPPKPPGGGTNPVTAAVNSAQKEWAQWQAEQKRRANAMVMDMKKSIQDGLATLIDPSTPGRIVGALGQVITQVISFIGQRAPTIITALSGWSIGLLTWVQNAWPGLMTALGNLGVQVAGLIRQYGPGIIQAVGAWAMALLGWIAQAAPGMLQQLGEAVGRILVAIGQALPGLVGAFAAWGVALTEWIITNGPNLLRELGTLGVQVLAWITAQAPGILAQLGQWGVQFFQWIIDAGPRLIMELGKLFGELLIWIVNANPQLKTNLDAWVTAFVLWSTMIWAPLLTNLSTFFTSIITWITTQAASLAANLTLGTSFIAGIVAGITGTVGTIFTTVQTGLDTALTDLAAYVEQFTSFGGDLIDGMISGIAAKAVEAAKAVKAVVDAALGGGQEQGEVQSPSRLFARELGAPIGQGVGVGIESTIPTAQSAMQNLVNGVAGVTGAAATLSPGLAGAGAGAGGLGGGTTIEQMVVRIELPNVTTAADLLNSDTLEQIAYYVATRIKRASR